MDEKNFWNNLYIYITQKKNPVFFGVSKLTLSWPVPSPDEKGGGLSVGRAPPRKNLLAIETMTTEFTKNTGRGRVFTMRTYEA